jgi:hypothetical protein
MGKNRVKKEYPELKFIQNFEKEFWFVDNKHQEAKKRIGENLFSYIIKQNIPGLEQTDDPNLNQKIKNYLEENKSDIVSSIKEKKKRLEDKWQKVEQDFFSQTEEITGLNWKHQNYKAYLLFSCLWGGDYEAENNNIYVNPLLEHGDPLYVVFHELTHLLYWQFIHSKYSANFINKNHEFLWELSEIMVNYPLLRLKLDIDMEIPLVVPPQLKDKSKPIVERFSEDSFIEIIKSEIKNKAG